MYFLSYPVYKIFRKNWLKFWPANDILHSPISKGCLYSPNWICLPCIQFNIDASCLESFQTDLCWHKVADHWTSQKWDPHTMYDTMYELFQLQCLQASVTSLHTNTHSVTMALLPLPLGKESKSTIGGLKIKCFISI